MANIIVISKLEIRVSFNGFHFKFRRVSLVGYICFCLFIVAVFTILRKIQFPRLSITFIISGSSISI